MEELAQLACCEAQRIGLIKPSAFGDVVQTLPLLPVLHERFPRAQVSWVVRRELAGLLEGHPHLREIIPFDRRGGWRGWRQLLRTLRRRRFDLVFDLQGLLRTGLMTWATRAPLRIGLQTAREGAHHACHLLLPDSGPLVPAHLRYWRVAEALGLGERTRQTIVHVPRAENRWAERELAALHRPLLAIHPGARWATKRWPVERFAVVAARAIRRYGFAALILGSRDERPVAGRLEYELRRFSPAGTIANLSGKTTIKQLAALLQNAEVLLTNDSGPMHLAAGLNTPVLGVFTCTDPRRSGPPGERHELVTTGLPCRNCYKKHCPLARGRKLACLNEVTLERVWSAFERLLGRLAARHAA